jgi:hypothetical protein
MPTLAQLRGMAKLAGVPASTIRSATSAEELQTLITETMNGGAPAAKPKRTATKKTAARKPVRKPAAKTPVKKSPASKSKPAAKSQVGKAKRTTAVNGDDPGRHLLGAIDYSQTEGWNPRPGTPPDLIIKALRKYRGNREKVFQALLPTIKRDKLVKPKMNDGTLRTKDSSAQMLRYRISRTAWDFAMKTGQHEKSENRAEYRKKAPVRKPVKKTVARKPVATKRPTKKKTAARR